MTVSLSMSAHSPNQDKIVFADLLSFHVAFAFAFIKASATLELVVSIRFVNKSIFSQTCNWVNCNFQDLD
ncbi:hypothetical protein BLOT_000572 [Blomia tropicalis]|nr:hypothetical protein BLOT_000572 [Blomia tropicalis]